MAIAGKQARAHAEAMDVALRESIAAESDIAALENKIEMAVRNITIPDRRHRDRAVRRIGGDQIFRIKHEGAQPPPLRRKSFPKWGNRPYRRLCAVGV